MLLALLLSLCAGEQWISPVTGLLLVANCSSGKFACHDAGCIAGWCGAGYIRRCNAGLFENPLAEPGLLGVSNGAGVGLSPRYCLGKGNSPTGR